MSVLVYTESENGTFKKTAFEVASYAKAVADQLGTTVTAVAVNANDVSELGKYGVDKVLKVSDATISAIGYECGFATPAHLTKVFKTKYNKTPSQYRLDFSRK